MNDEIIKAIVTFLYGSLAYFIGFYLGRKYEEAKYSKDDQK